MISDLAMRLAKLEAASKKTSSRKKITKADMELLAEAIGKVPSEALRPVEQRLAKLRIASRV